MATGLGLTLGLARFDGWRLAPDVQIQIAIGLGVTLGLARFGVWRMQKAIAFKRSSACTAFVGQSNILEDKLFGPLISVPNNCLPGCWAREDNKQENFNNNMLVKGPVGPVQCCGGAYGRGVRPSGLPPHPLYYYIC